MASVALAAVILTELSIAWGSESVKDAKEVVWTLAKQGLQFLSL